MSIHERTIRRLFCVVLATSLPGTVNAQQMQLPPTYGAVPSGSPGFTTAPPGTGLPPAGAPGFPTVPPGTGTGLPPAGSPGFGTPTTAPPVGTPGVPTLPPTTMAAPPPAQLGTIQPFDPYALPPGGSALPPPLGTPGAPPQTWPAPGITTGAPYGTTPGGGYGAPPGATPYGPPSTYGVNTPTSGPPYNRLFQDTGMRYTFLAGDGKGDSMQMNDLEFSTTAFFPRFLGTNGPLRFTPGFVFHWLSGPSPPVESDMPARLYSAHLDFGWTPKLSPAFSADLNFRTGLFSDFKTTTKHSVRFIFNGAGIINISPRSAIKLGGAYIDRADLKFLPIFGFLWTPNPQTRWDITFPSPKLASYLTTSGNSQLWGYLGAEYGGGSWTMDRPEEPMKGASERVDINDIRIYLGLEWHNLNRWYGFFEVGYVFNRELFYVVVPEDRVKLEETLMLRAGISF